MSNKLVPLGRSAKMLAAKMQEYGEYQVFDTGKLEDLLKGVKVEEIEEVLSKKGKTVFKSLKTFAKQDSILFILSGEEDVSFSTLVLSEVLKDSGKSIVYLKPTASALSKDSSVKLRASLGVLQEYARSGNYELMTLIDYGIVETLTSGLSLVNYEEKLSETVAYALYMLDSHKEQRAILDSTHEDKENYRIATIGAFNPSTGENSPFYDLAFPRNTRMFYYLTQESINSPDQLVKIKSSNYELNEAQPANNYSFAVYGNNYPHDYGYFIQTTNYVQEYGGQNNP